MSYPSFEAALVQSGIIIEPDPQPYTLREALELLHALEARYRAERGRWQPAVALEPESDD